MDANASINVKIGDFGLAKQAAPMIHETIANWNWCAPEVINFEGRGYSEISDVFSYGILLWEIVVGPGEFNLPYSEYFGIKSDAKIKVEICENELRPTIPEYCPENFKSLIENCWRTNPEDRLNFLSICRILFKFTNMSDDESEKYSIKEKTCIEPKIEIVDTISFNDNQADDVDLSVSSMLHIDDQTIALGFDDGSIRIFNVGVIVVFNEDFLIVSLYRRKN